MIQTGVGNTCQKVTSRKGRVSRNVQLMEKTGTGQRHVPQGACE